MIFSKFILCRNLRPHPKVTDCTYHAPWTGNCATFLPSWKSNEAGNNMKTLTDIGKPSKWTTFEFFYDVKNFYFLAIVNIWWWTGNWASWCASAFSLVEKNHGSMIYIEGYEACVIKREFKNNFFIETKILNLKFCFNFFLEFFKFWIFPVRLKSKK
jgi:hypothetical protein